MNVYEIVTERFLKALSEGTAPWRKPWACATTPKNLTSKKEYRGCNILLLACAGFDSPYWLTYKQATEKGGQVRKGEKGTPVIFWKIGDDKRADKAQKNGKPGKSFLLRYYTVFNVQQCDGLESALPTPSPDAKQFSPIEACENLVKSYNTIPPISYGGDRACYNPTFDQIKMPSRTSFASPEEFYSTLFHELTHSTGHETRLNRDGVTSPIRFGSHDYSFEELIAECGSAFLCGKAGIANRTLENSAAYIANWATKLQSEPKWIVEAASKAMKSVDYMLGVKFGEEAKEATADLAEAAE